MQGPTHILAGILFDKTFRKISARPCVRYGVTCLFGVTSHIILDSLNSLTYHPSHPKFWDPFWLLYHLLILFGTLLLVRRYWARHKFAIFVTILPDMDWAITSLSKLLQPCPFFWNEPVIHNMLSLLIPNPVRLYLNLNLPDWRMKKSAVVTEMSIIGVLFIALYIITRRDSLSHRRWKNE